MIIDDRQGEFTVVSADVSELLKSALKIQFQIAQRVSLIRIWVEVPDAGLWTVLAENQASKDTDP